MESEDWAWFSLHHLLAVWPEAITKMAWTSVSSSTNKNNASYWSDLWEEGQETVHREAGSAESFRRRSALCISVCLCTIPPSFTRLHLTFKKDKQYLTSIKNVPFTIVDQKWKHNPSPLPKCGPELEYWINNTYSYHPVTPSTQSQNLLEKYICSSADWGEKYERTPNISGTCIIERPYLTVIIIHDNLEGKLLKKK